MQKENRLKDESYNNQNVYHGVDKNSYSYFMNSVPSYVSLKNFKHVYFKGIFRFSSMISSSSWVNSPFVPSADYL